MMGLCDRSFLVKKATERKVRKLWIFEEKGNIHDHLI